MIEKVEDTAADASRDAFSMEGQKNTAGNLKIERGESRETIDVAGPDVHPVNVLDRVRKAGMNVVDRNHRKFPRRRKRPPNQEAIRRVERQTAPRIRLDHRLSQV